MKTCAHGRSLAKPRRPAERATPPEAQAPQPVWELARRQEHAAKFRSGWQRFQKEDPLHASVMTWVVEDGLSTDDIAHLLDRTPGATREFISQCRKAARRYLADWYALAGDKGNFG